MKTSTIPLIALLLTLPACDSGPDFESAEIEEQGSDRTYEPVPGNYPLQVGETTICSIGELTLDGVVDRKIEFYVLGRMNEELDQDALWRNFSAIDHVETCAQARLYNDLRREYEREYASASVSPETFPEEPLYQGGDEPTPRIGEPPGGLANDANVDAVVQIGMAGSSCSGTLIHPRVVLTAAHCIPTPGDGDVWLKREENTTVIDWKLYPATSYRNEHYTGVGDSGDDVGLVIFDNPIPGVDNHYDTMRVLTSSMGVPEAIKFYGWGTLTHQGTGFGVLRWGLASINSASGPSFSDIVYTGGARFCKGDSGGPATYNKEVNNLTYDLAGGIASYFSNGSNYCPYPNGAQHWAATSHKIDWIELRLLAHGLDFTGDPTTACHRYTQSGRNYMRCW